MTAPVLVFAIGNESRGDDALAPLLLRRLDAWLESARQGGCFELLEEFQLQLENTLDMQGRELVLFIDAGMGTPAPFSFYRAAASDTHNLFSHALPPEAILALYLKIYHEAAPPAFVLCLRGEQFELGAPVSAEAAGRVNEALDFMQGLLRQADVKSWDAQARALAVADREMLAL